MVRCFLRVRSVAGVSVLALGLVVACGPAGGGEGSQGADVDSRAGVAVPLFGLLQEGEVLFGAFSGPTTPGQGAVMGRNHELDFVFYSLESGPFDLATLQEYMAGISEGAAPQAAHPVVLRVPPVRDGTDETRARVGRALELGLAGIVFPHVESALDATVAVEAMGPGTWPGDPGGARFNILIVEDKIGVERVDEIVATPGVSVVFPGPGDLRRAYGGDMAAVEDAIQAVLAACKLHGVACGITAGVEDIEERISQGFSVFIVSDLAAVSLGRAAAGRS